MTQHKRDMILAIALLIFSISSFIYTELTIGDSVIEYTLAKPNRYVELWLAIYALLAVALLIRSLRKKSSPTVLEPLWHRAGVITVISSVVYLLTMQYLGFIPMTFIFLLVLGMSYTYYTGKLELSRKSILQTGIKWCLYAAIVTFALYYLFSMILGVVLPSFAL